MFADFLLDPNEGVLLRNGQPVSLTPKAFQTLVALVEKSGHLVTKEELLQAVWPDSFVEEGNLKFNVSMVRKAIGDQGSYIETIPRRGYRFIASVQEVSETQRSAIAVSRPTTRPSRYHRTLQVSLPVLFLFLIAGSLLVYWTSHRPPRSFFPSRKSIAVLGFKNLTGRPDEDWLSRVFSEEITTELAAGEKLRILPEEDISRVKRELSLPDADSLATHTLARVHQNLPTDFVVLGSYADLNNLTGDQIRLDLRLQNAATGEIVTALSETAPVDDLFALVSRAGNRLRQALDIQNVTSAQIEGVRAALPANSQAARLYAEGVSKLRLFDGVVSTELLEKAVSFDPDYPMAHSALAEAWALRGYDERSKQEAKRACDLSTKLPREQQLLAQARYVEANSEWPKAIELYRTLFTFFPDNLNYGLKLAEVQASARRGSDALQTIASLRTLPRPLGDDPRIDLAEAAAQESLGSYKQVLSAAQHAAEKSRILGARLILARALFYQGWALQNIGGPAEALAAATQAQQLYSAVGDRYWEARTLLTMAEISRRQDNLDNALAKTQAALSVDQQTGNKAGMAWDLNEHALVSWRRGDLDQARNLYEQALVLFRDIDDKRGTSVALNNIANLLDEQGDLRGAIAMYQRALALSNEINNERDAALTMTNIGEERFALGDLNDAQQRQQHALAIAQKLGDNSIAAYALYGLGQVCAAEGRVTDARAHYQEALRLRNQLQEKGNAAETIVALAKLPDQLVPSDDSITRLNQALDEFKSEKLIDDELLAASQLARNLLLSGLAFDARRKLALISPTEQQTAGRAARLEFALAKARVDAELGRTAEAQTETNSVLAQATQQRYRGYELEARLLLGELALRSGNSASGQTQLRVLERDARRDHFVVIADDAATALSNNLHAQRN